MTEHTLIPTTDFFKNKEIRTTASFSPEWNNLEWQKIHLSIGGAGPLNLTKYIDIFWIKTKNKFFSELLDKQKKKGRLLLTCALVKYYSLMWSFHCQRKYIYSPWRAVLFLISSLCFDVFLLALSDQWGSLYIKCKDWLQVKQRNRNL